MSTQATSVFKDPEVAGTLSTIHDKYEAHNSISLICKKHYTAYIDCLKIELSLDSTQGNPTYTATMLPNGQIIDNYLSCFLVFP
jgi:hypothetical protein